MELTLNQVPMEGYICPLETVVYQEETQESIVPDACPDILSVLATEARVQLTKKEVSEGKGEIWGNVQVTVVYCPDDGTGARHLEVTIPYRVTVAGQEMDSGGTLVAVPRVVHAETRVLNPRKVLCRVELAVTLQGWKENQDTLCLPQEDRGELQRRFEEVESFVAVALGEKVFAYTDQVSLNASHSAAVELLGHRLELGCTEAKVIGNKLIFKGEAVLLLRYRTEENTVAVGRWELPFSQIMEVDGVEEEGSCTIELLERESQVALLSEGDGRSFSVHLELLAQAVVRQNKVLRVFADAYSVSHAVTVRRKNFRVKQRWEENSVTQMGREILETSLGARSVEDCFLTLGVGQVEPESGKLTVQGKMTALYVDEEGQLQAQEGTIELSTQVSIPKDGQTLVRCELAGQPQAVATAAGIEVRVNVRFHYLITRSQEVSAVEALEMEEEAMDRSEKPSVVLRVAQSGESLWDIAKAYFTTEEDILAVNEISEPERLAGQMLLIPRSR